MGFTIVDNDVAAFPLQAQIYELDIAILSAGYDGFRVADGCEVTPQGSPDMTVAIAMGAIHPGDGSVALVASGNLSIDAAHATLWRLDLISASSSGTKTYTAGTAAVDTAVKPPALPTGHTALAIITVPPTATAIASDSIVDKRLFWDSAGTLSYQDHGATGAAETVDATVADIHRLVLDAGTVTLTLIGAPASGTPGLVRLLLYQDGVGGRFAGWPGSVVWQAGAAPTLSTDPAACDIVDLFTVDAGATYLGVLNGASGPAGADGADGAGVPAGGATSQVLAKASNDDFDTEWSSVGGGVATDAIWDAAGDLVQGTGADTAAKLTLGAAGTVVRSTGSTNAYAFPPGHELDYVERTSAATITATVEASADTVITGSAVAYDGSTPVLIHIFADYMVPDGTVDRYMQLWLFDGSSSIGHFGDFGTVVNTKPSHYPISVFRKLTPSAGTHTYSVRCTVSAGTGYVIAGAGGGGNNQPAFLRITKV